MIQSLLTATFAVWVINAALSGLAGHAVARRRGHPAVVGVLPSVLVPWVGIVVPIAVPSRSSGRRSPVGRPILFGFIPLVGGVLLMVTSLFWSWVSVSGNVDMGSQQFAESADAGLGDATFGSGAMAFGSVLVMALGVTLWLRPLVRVAVPLTFVAASAASLGALTLLGSTLANRATVYASELSAGHTEASLVLGTGAWLACLGAAFLMIGAVRILVATTRSEARWQAPPTDSGHSQPLLTSPVAEPPASSTVDSTAWPTGETSSRSTDWDVPEPAQPPGPPQGW